MQSVLSRIWTRVAVSISFVDNHYTTDPSQSRYYVHFRTNTPRKGMNLIILPAMGKIVLLLFF